MSVLVYVEHFEGKIKRASLEAACYAAQVAEETGTETIAVALGEIAEDQLATLGIYGVSKVLHVNDSRLNQFDSKVYARVVSQAAEVNESEVVVLSFNQNGKNLAPRLSARLQAGLVPGAITKPDFHGGFKVQKNVFSGKGIATFAIKTEKKIIALNPNSIPLEKTNGSAKVEAFTPLLSENDFSIKVKSVEKLSGDIPLSEAELVVSGGRGLRGPENWEMIETLAKEIGAATACSRAVTDVEWRPHHEHVGQTGLTIRPNLYIAIAISGAIQHLAGVNGSKVMVVINTDPEAPFFKAADYGIVGDAFEVVPRLVESIKKFKATSV